MTVVPVDPIALALAADDDFDDLAGAATLPNLGPLDDDPVAHPCVHSLILRRRDERLERADRATFAAPDFRCSRTKCTSQVTRRGIRGGTSEPPSNPGRSLVNCLRELERDMAQGYLLARPQPPEALDELLRPVSFAQEALLANRSVSP